MGWDVLKTHWALVLGVLIALPVSVSVVVHLVRRSAHGQLQRVRADLKLALRTRRSASRHVDRAERRVNKLLAHKQDVKPRLLQEANEALEDARALAKIADDKVMIAENHVRRVIVEEFPPRKHDRMRRRYLSRPQEDKEPFHFDR